MKKRLSVFILMLLPMLASADAVKIGGIYYNLTEETRVAEVTSNPGKYDGSITIPESVEYEGITYSVTAICSRAFYGCKDLWYVTIPNKVTKIEEETFWDCRALRSVHIPNSVTTIGASAFSGCWHLTSVTIPSSVTFIDEWAFSDCEKLMDVYCYAENVPNIRNNPFLDTKIEDVTLHVPAASISAYKIVRPWKTFKEIVALTAEDEYRPLLEEGKIWQYGYNSGVRKYMKRLSVGGDTIIGDQTYKKIINVGSQDFEMFLREEGRKVFCRYPNQNTESLLYDFGKDAGDIVSREIKNRGTWIRKVISVDTIIVKANTFRCMTVHEYCIPEGMSEEEYFAGNYGYDRGFWVEGIGSFTYLDTPIDYPGNYYSFNECRIGGNSFKQRDFLNYINYITNDIQSIKAVKSFNDAIYDLQGRRIQGELQRGIYIQNGKKFIK